MTIGSILVKIGSDISGLTQGLNQSEKRLAAFGSRMTSIGRGLSLGLTAPLLAIGGAAMAAASQVDGAMKTIRKGTGATGADLKALGDDFRSVFSSIPASAADAAKAIADLNTRTGATGPALQALAAQVLNLSKLTGDDLGATIASTTRLFGDWGVATDKQADTLDHLFKISQSTGIGVDALASKLVQFGAPLRQMGFSFEQSAALMGKWEKEGVNAELVLGSLRIALGKFAEAGVDAPKALQGIIAKMEQLGPGAEATSLAIKVFGARAGPDMAAAITEGRFAIDGLMRSIAGSPETIARASAETRSFGDNLQVMKNQAALALQPLGAPMLDALTNLTPAFTKVLGLVVKLGEGFAALPVPVQQTTIAIGGLLALLGPAVLLLAPLATGLTKVAAGFKLIAPFAAAAAPWAAIATGAGLLTAGFFKLGSEVNKARQNIAGLGKEVKTTVAAAATGPRPLVLDMITVTAKAGTKAVTGLGNALGATATKAKTALETLQDRVGTLTGLWDVMTQRGESTISVGSALAKAYDAATAALARQKDQLSANALIIRRMLADMERVRFAAVAPVNTTPAVGSTLPAIRTTPITRFAQVFVPAGRAVATLRGELTSLSGSVASAAAGMHRFTADVFQAARQMMQPREDPLTGETIAGLGFAAAIKGGLVFAAVMEVVSAAMESLAPILDALMIPLRLIGQLIASALLPPLRGLAYAIGWLIRGIGKLVDKIPGVSGGPLIRAGQEMIDAAEGMAIATNGAAEAVSKMASSLTNVPAMLQVDRLRAQATAPVAIGTGGTATPLPQPVPPTLEQNNTYQISVTAAPGQNGADLVVEIGRELRRRAGSFGSNAQSLAQAWPA